MPNDQYQLGELLGRGGMGQVHAARHRSGRAVAVKRVRNTLALDRVVVERLADEARLLRSVSHPNVVRALDDGTGSDGMPFLVMDRAHGTPLNQLIAQHGSMPRERMTAIASQLFAGLTAIHDAQIVHADLKSHNVLVDEVDIVTIIDFGLARSVNDDTLPNDLVAGTPAYMAPEMIAGAQPTIAADIYALATIIYEMLTGSTPFTGHISTILTRQLSEPVEPPSHRAPNNKISLAVDRAVMRGLEAAPAARYQSVPELAAAFIAALDDDIAHDPALGRGSELLINVVTVRERPRPRTAREYVSNRADQMISAALDRAHQLIQAHRVKRAVEELENALRALTPAIESEQPMCAAAWRIETVLAALYDSLGKHDRARRLARVAYRHALRTGCPLAEGRARELVDRFVVRSRRLARGTGVARTDHTTDIYIVR